MVLVTLPV